MFQNMVFKFLIRFARKIAINAFKRFLIGVTAKNVLLQKTCSEGGVIAASATVRPFRRLCLFSCVCLFMLSHILSRVACFVTKRAFVHVPFTVPFHMFDQIRFAAECLITLGTFEHFV